MLKYLFIAEKPSSMREFSSVYNKHSSLIDKSIGGTIEFISLRGHVFRNQEPKEYESWNKKWVDLYQSDLPMIPDVWKIKPISGAEQAIKNLKEKLKEGFDGIIVGTDSDVEGYGIYYMVCVALGLQKYKTLRFYETALTEDAILKSFQSMSDLYSTPQHKNALNAYIFRSRWDWLIGMNLTTAYTVRFGELIKFGSVKAPTLKIIYDNCNAIDNFKESISYCIKSSHTDGFESILTNDDDNKDRVIETKSDADAILKQLKSEAVVKSYTKKTNITKAPKLYSLSDLQIDAAKPPYNYSPDETLAIAQDLYEKRKILSYPRTSGNYLATSKVPDLPKIISSIKDVPDIKSFASSLTNGDFKRVASDSNIINDKEVAKAAHDALIPTGAKVDWDALTKKEKDVFSLVCKRLVAHFLPYFSEEKTTVILENGGYKFRANGRRTIENGFNDIFGKTVDDLILPEYKSGDLVKIDLNSICEKVSVPPSRYSTGTIIKAMKNIASQVTDPQLKKVMKESEGIGTEATRANIIKDLQDTGYISTRKNAIYITDAGKRYIENIRTENGDKYDYGIADPLKVAYWSAKGKEIQLGLTGVKDALSDFYKYLNTTIENIKASGPPEKRQMRGESSEEHQCPCCGEAIKFGRYGWYCSCGFSLGLEICGHKMKESDLKDLIQNGKTKQYSFKSKAGKSFKASLVFDKKEHKTNFEFASSNFGAGSRSKN